MKRIIICLSMLIAACTTPSYSGIDRPSTGGNTAEDMQIIDYIDKRLETEYYWLDEVESKCNTFDRHVEWEKYLSNTLSRLETNIDDGYVNDKGQRVFYSYIREIPSDTRAQVSGFGIDLHYTVLIIDKDNGYYGFLIENVYPGSPAAAEGVKRGDIITMVGDGYISPNNYINHFNSIQGNTATALRLTLSRQTTKETLAVEISKGAYEETPVVYSRVIDVDGFDRRIGYIVYTGFESAYDEDLLAVMQSFKDEGVGEVILDLRCNGGGSVNSAVKLCSALVPEKLEDGVLCTVQRNPRNKAHETESHFNLVNTGDHLTTLENLTVICSDYSASASELVIMGLRGLDFPVKLIGSTTEGKNCGMDVTRRTINNNIMLEYAPITFMCFNAKGVGDWGEGILPDVDLTDGSNAYGVSDKHYPLPRADWGDQEHDIALAVALASVTGRGVTTTPDPELQSADAAELTLDIPRPIEGIRNYVE